MAKLLIASQTATQPHCNAGLAIWHPTFRRLSHPTCSRSQVIFRNVHKLLADTASAEFLFCLDFWEDEPLFRELVGPIVAVVEGDLQTQLQVGGWV